VKRTNVIVDEELLEKARAATGERTYSATINKALNVVVRQHEFWKAYDRFAKEAAKGDFFDPDYVKERWPEVAAPLKKKRSAYERRLPQSRMKAK
jgi:hypothetical protein